MCNENKPNSLRGVITPHQFTHGIPALMIPVGIVGSYYVAFNPEGHDKPWDIGFIKTEGSFIQNPLEDAPMDTFSELYPAAVEGLARHFNISVHEEIVYEFEKAVNVAIATNLDFVFDHYDRGLSYNPSLKALNEGTMYYIVSELSDGKQKFIAGFGRVDDLGNATESPAELLFENARDFLIEKAGVKIAGDVRDNREVENFLGYVKLLQKSFDAGVV